MRFGTFHLPMSPDEGSDRRVIFEQIDQIVAAEWLGFETAWLTEHNFTGECAYGDPLPLAAALAGFTSTIRVGFAVVQMALHHPTRLAIQCGLIDNLLGGRLTLGIGKGSSYNEYEYVAFGLRSDGQRERLFEAVDLLRRAWTEDGLRYQGEFFDVTLPPMRPRPVQQPHPPIILSVLSDDTLTFAAQQALPVMFARIEADRFAERIAFYRTAMAAAGHDDATIDRAVGDCTLLRSVYIADTDEQAHEKILAPTYALHGHLQHARATHNPADVDIRSRARWKWTSPDTPVDEAVADLISRGFIVGSAETVAREIAALETAGCQNLMIAFTWGGMESAQSIRSMERFAAEVMPRFSGTLAGAR